MKTVEIELYVTDTGKRPFDKWAKSLTSQARAIIRRRLARLELGNFGDSPVWREKRNAISRHFKSKKVLARLLRKQRGIKWVNAHKDTKKIIYIKSSKIQKRLLHISMSA